MSDPIHALNQAQFAPAAQDYVTSATHAHGADLARLRDLAAPQGHEWLLDIATGGGHTALLFAPLVRYVVAHDLTDAMLRAARGAIVAQGQHNLGYLRAPAECLPCRAAAFDLVTCRIAAHHFADVRAFVREAARVLKPGGKLLISDHIGLEDPELDAFMDAFERRRDPSHVRAYSYAEWQALCAEVGLTVVLSEDDPREPYEYASWTARMRMPAEARDALARDLLAAAPRFREFFAITEANGQLVSLRSTFGIIVAVK